jgi:spore maturation protein B
MIESISDIFNTTAKYIIPLLLTGIPFYAIAVKKVKVYEVFTEGAKEGFEIAIRIIPYLVAILVAIGMLRASGALDLFLDLLAPVLDVIGFPKENIPLALMRPLSGGGSYGLLSDLVETYGQNSLIAKIGATMYGSTETTFYVLAVYFGSVGIKKVRHAVVAGLIADLVGILSAVYICRLFFGSLSS